jgi:acyl-coenzyme A thioesterase PaaI-like protein
MLNDAELEYALIEAIPLHRFLGLRTRADGAGGPPRVSVAGREEHGNHLGATSGAVIFAVAEAASAAMVFSAYTALIDRAFAVPSDATIRFLRPAVGEIIGRARPGPPEDAVALDLEERGAAVLQVAVDVSDESHHPVAELTVHWQFRPLREGAARALPRRDVKPAS